MQVPDHLAAGVDYYLEVEATQYGQQDGSEFRYRQKLSAGGELHRRRRLVLATDRPIYLAGTTVSGMAWLAGGEEETATGGSVHHMEAWLLGPRGQMMAAWPRRPLSGSGGRRPTVGKAAGGNSLEYRLATRAPLGQWTLRAKLGQEVGPF